MNFDIEWRGRLIRMEGAYRAIIEPANLAYEKALSQAQADYKIAKVKARRELDENHYNCKEA